MLPWREPRDPRTTLEDFDGMRVRATGGLGKAFEAVGAVPTSVTATEAYNAMESGVVDTVAFAQHAHLSFGTINKQSPLTVRTLRSARSCSRTTLTSGTFPAHAGGMFGIGM